MAPRKMVRFTFLMPEDLADELFAASHHFGVPASLFARTAINKYLMIIGVFGPPLDWPLDRMGSDDGMDAECRAGTTEK